MLFGIGSGAPVGPSMAAMATSTPIVPSDAKIRGLKLEIPEKFIGRHVPAIVGWLTKMERYFQLMKHPTDVWVDVIATRITDTA